jgi:phosphoserine phosphatase
LISAAYQPAVEQFARKIAEERTYGIGTPVEIIADKFQLAGALNSRERKLDSLMDVVGERSLSVALGDTFADIPVLELAVKAIAVHPDQKLRTKAIECGWQILE